MDKGLIVDNKIKAAAAWGLLQFGDNEKIKEGISEYRDEFQRLSYISKLKMMILFRHDEELAERIELDEGCGIYLVFDADYQLRYYNESIKYPTKPSNFRMHYLKRLIKGISEIIYMDGLEILFKFYDTGNHEIQIAVLEAFANFPYAEPVEERFGMDNQKIIPVLILIKKEEFEEVKTKGEEARKALELVYTEESDRIRALTISEDRPKHIATEYLEHIIEALGFVGNDKTVSELKSLRLKFPDFPSVQQAAMQAIIQIAKGSVDESFSSQNFLQDLVKQLVESEEWDELKGLGESAKPFIKQHVTDLLKQRNDEQVAKNLNKMTNLLDLLSPYYKDNNVHKMLNKALSYPHDKVVETAGRILIGMGKGSYVKQRKKYLVNRIEQIDKSLGTLKAKIASILNELNNLEPASEKTGELKEKLEKYPPKNVSEYYELLYCVACQEKLVSLTNSAKKILEAYKQTLALASSS